MCHCVLPSPDAVSARTVICYATNWPQYRPGQGKFRMSDVDPSKCTIMVFAFAKVVGNTLDNYEENDVGPNGQYMQFTNLKRQHPQVKTLLGVGGWNHGGDPFSAMAATARGRAEFIRSTIDYLRRYKFDGLDLDWEYPKANDKQNLVSLLQELRQAFDAERAQGRPPLLLLMAVAAGLQNAVPAYDVPALNRYVK
ncbi:chitinase-3 [Elysia marginata]|uniref:Chitinase-3 n=1 Tax=Elysia marginata TaxID=1093978 RepID=A0AAV4FAG5_9GAST|nr:chitinase-3 [Elysia marginata]